MNDRRTKAFGGVSRYAPKSPAAVTILVAGQAVGGAAADPLPSDLVVPPLDAVWSRAPARDRSEQGPWDGYDQWPAVRIGYGP